MKKLYILLFAILISGLSFGQVINEFEPNPVGTDPTNVSFELKGTPSSSFSGYILSIESDADAGASIGRVDRFSMVSGTFDSNGLLVVSIPDLENPSFTVVLVSSFSGDTNTDIDTDDDGTIDNTSTFGTVYDAIGIPDTTGEPLFGAQLGGSDFAYTGDEPGLVFRDGSTGDWYAVNDPAGSNVYDILANPVAGSAFNIDPTTAGTSFGSINPILSSTPTLALTDGPTNGDTVVGDPETVNNATIDFATTNFTMSTDAGGGTGSGGDGFIKWTVETSPGAVFVDGGNIFTSNDTNTTYPVTGLAVGETYYFEAELVDNNGDPLSSPVVYSFTITIATYTDVPDLATLRSQTVDPDLYYRVTGEVFNTYSRSSNNQKYFQDATGGILVHDPDGIISTVYSEGDGVTNMRGHLELYNGLMEFIPTDNDNWGTSSTGNTITPEVVTIANIESSLGTYESKLVRINNVTFADGDGINTFASNPAVNYNIDDGTATTPPSTFRTTFWEADYIGQTIPNGATNILVIVGNFNGSEQFTARSLSELTLSTKYNQIKGFAMYPNPTALGYVNIASKTNAKMNVAVFDLLGKQVLNKTVSNNKLNVSSLTSGVYIMKVSQDNAITTRKLVIQ